MQGSHEWRHLRHHRWCSAESRQKACINWVMVTHKCPTSRFSLPYGSLFLLILVNSSNRISYGWCRTDILILFLNQDPNLLRSYVVRQEGIPLLGLLVGTSWKFLVFLWLDPICIRPTMLFRKTPGEYSNS